MALTDKKVSSAKPKEKAYSLWDGRGLYLYVTKAGAKSWRVNYHFGGKQKTLFMGQYPAMSLADARKRRDEAMLALHDGIDPAAAKQAQKKEAVRQEQEKELTFEWAATDWCKVRKAKDSARTYTGIVQRLQLHILPYIGKKPLKEVSFSDLRDIVQNLEHQEKYAMAKRIALILVQVCRHSYINQWLPFNIADGLTSILIKRPEDDKRPHPAITDPEGVATMLRRLETFIAEKRATIGMCAALRLFPLLALRSQEILSAKWPEIDFEAKLWRVPAEHMKCGKAHDVPLSRQALEVLQELHEYRVTNNGFMFRSGSKSGHIEGQSVNVSMHRAGIPLGKMCVHGWRKVFSTLCHEAGAPAMLIEKALAHATGNPVAMAYNKAQYLDARRILMQWWADTLDALRDGTERPRLELERAAMFA